MPRRRLCLGITRAPSGVALEIPFLPRIAWRSGSIGRRSRCYPPAAARFGPAKCPPGLQVARGWFPGTRLDLSECVRQHADQRGHGPRRGVPFPEVTRGKGRPTGPARRAPAIVRECRGVGRGCLIARHGVAMQRRAHEQEKPLAWYSYQRRRSIAAGSAPPSAETGLPGLKSSPCRCAASCALDGFRIASVDAARGDRCGTGGIGNRYAWLIAATLTSAICPSARRPAPPSGSAPAVAVTRRSPGVGMSRGRPPPVAERPCGAFSSGSNVGRLPSPIRPSSASARTRRRESIARAVENSTYFASSTSCANHPLTGERVLTHSASCP